MERTAAWWEGSRVSGGGMTTKRSTSSVSRDPARTMTNVLIFLLILRTSSVLSLNDILGCVVVFGQC